ncbi:lipopolysaccharide biosynthesis protein [Methanolobus sp. ZRKC2]|uniref:lipopolysaccharide biosynthesis protein n=1 Tax=Methanolobus sp. ZRKC2 TaxID=3125783 RepID=UPI0032452DA1
MSLRKKTLSGIFWVGISTFLLKIINFSFNILLARLLSPSDFGLIAIALISINFFEIFRDFGIGNALIHRKGDIENAANTAFYLFPAIAILFYFISYTTAPYIADFFKEDIELIIRVLSLSLVIWSFGNLPRSLLKKELEFKKMTFVQLIPKIGYGLVSVFLALEGYGVWSLVIGRLILEILSTAFIWSAIKWRPCIKFSLAEAIELLNYGKHVLVSSLFAFIMTVIDTVIIGKNLGVEYLGYYTIGLSIANFFTIQLANIASQVLFPLYSKIENSDLIGLTHLKILKFSSYVIFPISFGIISVSENFILIFYGDKWVPTIAVLQILCIYGLTQSIQKISENVFFSMGKPKIVAKINLIQFLMITALIFPLTLEYGIIGTSISVMIPSLLTMFIALHNVSKVLRINYRYILETIFEPAIGSILMLFSIFQLKVYLQNFSDIIALGICIVSGLMIVFLFSYFMLKNDLKEIANNLIEMS